MTTGSQYDSQITPNAHHIKPASRSPLFYLLGQHCTSCLNREMYTRAVVGFHTFFTVAVTEKLHAQAVTMPTVSRFQYMHTPGSNPVSATRSHTSTPRYAIQVSRTSHSCHASARDANTSRSNCPPDCIHVASFNS